jgi:hypothetical protein
MSQSGGFACDQILKRKGFTVSRVIIDLYKQGHLKGALWKNITVPNFYSEKQMVKNTLEICEYVMTEEEKNALKNTLSLSDQELIENATNIEKRKF